MIGQSATLEINERVAAYRRAGRKILHLGFGEAGLPVLPELLERLREAAPENSYAPVAGIESAREAAAGYWTRRGLPTEPDQIVFGPGSKPLLYAALAGTDGDVILPEPSWVSYAAQTALTGRRVVWVPVPGDCGGVPDPDLLEEAVKSSNPSVVVLTLPDNPTGTLAPAETVTRVCEVADRHGLLILSDEIYRDLTHDESSFTSPAHLLPERTIVTSGLSKSLALGGWRIGFARIPSPQRARSLLGVASEVWSSMGTPTQYVAAYALGEPDPVRHRIDASRRLHAAVAAAVHDTFIEAGATVRKPTAGFYLYPELHTRHATGADLARHLLDEHNIAVLPGEAFGDHPRSLRFRVATSLLYGTDNSQRLAALAADAPAELHWIRASVRQLRNVMTAL